ncbi:hypothetical protein ACLB2K_045982 [Fragaria x ananassa]
MSLLNRNAVACCCSPSSAPLLAHRCPLLGCSACCSPSAALLLLGCRPLRPGPVWGSRAFLRDKPSGCHFVSSEDTLKLWLRVKNFKVFQSAMYSRAGCKTEQSAAEVALRELSKSGDAAQCISQPVQEIGLCKNLLQEYAQKMNFSVPVYLCKTDFSSGKTPVYSCTVEIGGIRYIGATAKTKKEAEIKVARTALLAIWLSSNESSMGSFDTSELTVLPSNKRRLESEETSNKPKRKKVPFSRKRMLKRKPNEENAVPGLESNEAMPQDSVSEDIPHANNVYAEHGPSTASDLTNGSNGNGFVGCGDITTLAKEVNMVSAVKPMTAEAMPQHSVSEDIPHANNVYAEHGPSTASDLTIGINGNGFVGCGDITTLAKDVNMVSAVKPMTAEAMPQDSVSEDIPHANNVYAEHGPSTASELTNRSNGNGFVGCGDITTLAKEVNMVSAVKPMTADAMPQDSVFEHIPHAKNVNAEHGLSTTSDFNATNGSCAVGDSISPSSENTTTSAKEGNMVSAGPYLEASSVMPGPESLDQSQ